MPHTPHFHSFQQIVTECLPHTPSSARAPELSKSGFEGASSRRNFLRAGAVAVGGILSGGRSLAESLEHISPVVSQPRIVIVGGGITGLTAANELRQAGVACKIFEASTQVGGRMLTIENEGTGGKPFDLGGSYVNSNHTNLIRLAASFGIPLVDLSELNRGLSHVSFFNGQRQANDEVAEAIKPFTDAIRELKIKSQKDPKFAAKLDYLSIDEFLDKLEMKAWAKELIRVMYTSEWGIETGKQPIWNILDLMGSELEKDFKMYGSGGADMRYLIRGGSQALPCEIAKSLPEQTLQTGTQLVRIRQPNRSLELTFKQHDGRTLIEECELLILTIPFTALRKVEGLDSLAMDPSQRRMIGGLQYGQNSKIGGGFQRPLWREKYQEKGWGSSDIGLQCFWEASPHVPGKHAMVTSFQGGKAGIEAGKSTAAERFRDDAELYERIYPGLQGLRVPDSAVRAHWPSMPNIEGSYACPTLGDRPHWSAMGLPIELSGATILLRGEHTSAEFQGYMEGGVEQGMRAGNEVLKMTRKVARRTNP